jgi:transposase InsO family protein
VKDAVVLKLVENVRKDEPRVGTRKLHHRLQPTLDKSGVSVGRDKLFSILRHADELVKPKRSYQKTTYSKHSYVVSPNRVKEQEALFPGQILVSDITYLRLRNGRFAYLFLTTDLYSRMIVGYHLSLDLSHHSALLALQMAVERAGGLEGAIHHSDRGSQYCCHEFRTALSRYEMLSSMTDEAHCYQNAVAERVNGILKDELALDAVFSDLYGLRAAVTRAITVYNTKRTHFSLGLRTPMEVYSQAA